jgi:hypothetical protein
MTTDAILVLAWLVLAHLVADFVLQTNRMVADKRSSGRRAWRGLLVHGSAVALCLVPFAVVYGAPGLVLLVIVTVGHVVIDRWKVTATRHAEATALAGAHRRREDAESAADTLGPAWTPVPGALFLVDQLLHLVLIAASWVFLIARAEPTVEWTRLIDSALGGVDRTEFHRWMMIAALGASVLIVNVRAGALFVATLVQPRAAVTGGHHAAHRGAPRSAASDQPERPASWRVRVGPVVATAEPFDVPATDTDAADEREGHASPARIGATIGILERLLIVTFLLTGSTAAIGFVVAAKTLARFKQLDDRDFAEYYLLGTLASVAVALGSALLAQAAFGTLAGS